jgi:flavorubredoxin
MHIASKTRMAPTLVAADTFVIHDHSGEGTAPVMVPLNSLVIRAAEPVVVDTGMKSNRDQYFTDLFNIVDPADIRWVFISHDDIDHTGNLNELMALAPNATAVVNWFIFERMAETLEVPPHRMRWISDGESFDAGDRTLFAVRPPVYDSPTTRGLFDPATGVYWASDAFAAPMIEPTTSVETIDPAFWAMGMTMFSQYVSPWFDVLDDTKFQATVDRVERLGVRTIAGCHTPVIGASHVAKAIEQTRTFANALVPAQPDQSVLDQIIASALAPAVA